MIMSVKCCVQYQDSSTAIPAKDSAYGRELLAVISHPKTISQLTRLLGHPPGWLTIGCFLHWSIESLSAGIPALQASSVWHQATVPLPFSTLHLEHLGWSTQWPLFAFRDCLVCCSLVEIHWDVGENFQSQKKSLDLIRNVFASQKNLELKAGR